MINKNLEQINESDLNQLITDAISEGKTIEYKIELPDGTDSSKKEFLADVSSFVNIGGGDLIFGIKEDNGLPIEINGIEVDNMDELQRRLDSIIQSGIEPRFQYHFKFINRSNSGKKVLIIRLERSWNPPHQVIYKNDAKFYARNSAGKYQLDLNELRRAFNLSRDVSDQIKNFRMNRIAEIGANNTPIRLIEGAKIIMHLVPLDSYNDQSKINLNTTANNELLAPMYNYGFSNQINLDGRLYYSTRTNGENWTYLQLYRNGVIEAVDVGMLESTDVNENRDDTQLYIASVGYEEELIKSLERYLKFYRENSFNVPIVLGLSLVGVKGYRMGITNGFRFDSGHPIDRDSVHLPDLLIDSYDKPASQILHPLFDLIWNACGLISSRNFNEEGEWIR